jgi:hypothetical protein
MTIARASKFDSSIKPFSVIRKRPNRNLMCAHKSLLNTQLVIFAFKKFVNLISVQLKANYKSRAMFWT